MVIFQSPFLILKCQKGSLNSGALVQAPAIYQTKCFFFVFRTLHYDLDYSLCGQGNSCINTQLNFLEIQ